jgi:prepilin-type processing-associated H-X9-DG protein/prepilin-type N-terminal cleavage/methylation domain-containing protein
MIISRGNPRENGRRRSGFSLIDLMVVLSIIGLLMSLVLPAVMDAREAARKLACTNNLRQVGLGLEEFESVQGRLPGIYWGSSGSQALGNKVELSFSPAGQIAGFIDSLSLAQQIPEQQPLGTVDPDWSVLDLPSPGVLRCPDDWLAAGEASSYRFCRGILPLWPKDPGGTFVSDRGLRISEITDGLAQTAFTSERLISLPSPGRVDPRRDLIQLDSLTTLEVAPTCIAVNAEGGWSAPGVQGWDQPVGNSWLSGRWVQNSYYHLFPPNSPWADCVKADLLSMAVLTARSNHPGGVNVLFGDGHVRFVSDGVNFMVWRAWATRNGGEPVSGE